MQSQNLTSKKYSAKFKVFLSVIQIFFIISFWLHLGVWSIIFEMVWLIMEYNFDYPFGYYEHLNVFQF
jgi:hypothetical protein